MTIRYFDKKQIKFQTCFLSKTGKKKVWIAKNITIDEKICQPVILKKKLQPPPAYTKQSVFGTECEKPNLI